MKKYAFLPGAMTALVGVVWAAWTVAWNPTSTALAVGGGLATLVGLSFSWNEIRAWFRDPRGVFAVNTGLSALLLVAILGMVNASTALKPVKFDLTASGRNTLASETRKILTTLPGDVVLKQFGRTPDPRVEELLTVFAGASPRVTKQFVDADKAVKQAREYGVIRNGTVIVERGAKYRKIEQVTEPALVTAILQVTSSTELEICFAQGDGERGMADAGSTGLSQLVASLNASNYRTQLVSLLEQDVPAACSVLVVAGLAPDAGQTRLGRLNGFLHAGGRVALLLDPPVDPQVAAWLAPFGIGVGSGTVIDNSPSGRSVGYTPDMPLGVSYNSHPITQGFNIATLFDRAVPLKVGQAEVGKPVPLVATGAGSFEKIDPASPSTAFQAGRDKPGPLTLAVASTFSRGMKDATLAEPRIVVFGDSDWVTNATLGRQGNRDLALRMTAWLAGEEEAHIVATGDRENRRTAMTEQMRTGMYLVNLLLLPAIPLVAGIVRLLRSRK